MNKTLTFGLIAAALTVHAHAAEGDIGPVNVKTIGTIGTAVGAHLAGNFEVTFDPPVTLPTGVICDSTYFTTRRAYDPDRLMFTMLREAKELKMKVSVRITDSKTLQAYPYPTTSVIAPARCSIMAVGYPAQ